ncbi:MAG: hypothetical protein WC683_01135 [bacterium]
MTDRPRDLPAHVIVALTAEQIRLLAVYQRVLWRDGEPDLRQWARMAAMPLARVRELARGMIELGAVEPNGAMPKIIRDYLAKLGRDRLL